MKKIISREYLSKVERQVAIKWTSDSKNVDPKVSKMVTQYKLKKKHIKTSWKTTKQIKENTVSKRTRKNMKRIFIKSTPTSCDKTIEVRFEKCTPQSFENGDTLSQEFSIRCPVDLELA